MVVVVRALSCYDLIGFNAYDNSDAFVVGFGDEALEITQRAEWIVIGFADDGEVAGRHKYGTSRE